MDLIEVEDARMMQPVNEIPLEGFVRQHRVRYIVKTAKGDVVLKFIGALRRRTVELNLLAADPEYDGKRKDLQIIGEALKQCDDSSMKAKQLQLAASLEPTFYEFFASCFDKPKMKSGAEVLAFADQLAPEDWRMLRILLLKLIAARPSGEVASSMIALSVKFGVQLADDLTLENMTAQQMAVLDQAAGDELAAVREAYRQ